MLSGASNAHVEEATQINTKGYYDHRSSSSKITIQDGGQYSANSEFNIKYYVNNRASAITMKHLQEHIAEGAFHNSDERCDPPKCYPETREAVQEEILSWIKHGDEDEVPKKILWLTGPAGTGKTAIAGSLAEICEEEGILAGSFFFSSYATSEDRKSKRRLVSTLAYALLQHEALQPLRHPILSSIDRDPSIFRRRLKDQGKALLTRPFHNASSTAHLDDPLLPKVIIIDGVDEVEADGSQILERPEARELNEKDQLEILSTLLQATRDPKFPFRILIASRPERVIQNFFSTEADHTSREVRLDEKYRPDHDIALLLRAKFSKIRRRYRLPDSWAGEEVIKELVEKASGQFIYAATVIRFLESGKASPERRLKRVVDLQTHEDDGLNPFARLDALYRHILAECPDPTLVVKWLSAMARFHSYPALFVGALLQDEAGQAGYLLENLTSLLHVPDSADDMSPYKLYHRSILDFLSIPQRCSAALSSSYGDQDFLSRQYRRVLVSRGPVTSLEGVHWARFVEFFCHIGRKAAFQLLGRASLLDGKDDPTASGLTQCDVSWWMGEVISHLCAHGNLNLSAQLVGGSDSAPTSTYSPSVSLCGSIQLAGEFFDYFHFDRCILERGTNCVPVCKHWRNGTLAAFRLRGWVVPDALYLVRERMWYADGDPSKREAFHSPEYPFRPREEHEFYTSIDYGDYETLLKRANDIYSRLPNDWSTKYQAELGQGGYLARFSALEVEIADIQYLMESDT